MAYKIRCTSCGKSMRLPEGDAGLAVVCLACGTKFLAPPSDEDGQATTTTTPPPTNVTAATRPVAQLLDTGPLAEPAAVGPQAAPARAAAPTAPPRRRLSWAWVGVAAGGLMVLGALTAFVFLNSGHRSGVKELQRMLGDAQDLASAGQLQEARQKLRALDARATEIGADRPDVKAVADRARFEQEQLYAAILAQRPPPPATPPATPTATPPATAPAETSVAAAEATTSPASRPAVAQYDPIMDDKPPADASAQAANDAPGDTSTQPAAASPAASGTTTKPAPVPAVARRPRPALKPVPEKAAGITDEQIGASIQRGVNWLVGRFNESTGELNDGGTRGADEGYVCGLNALCVYALLQSGQSIPDERLNVRGPFMRSLIDGMKRLPANGGKVTYARAIRATALALYNRKEDRSALAADVLYLRETHTDGAYSYMGVRSGASLKGPGPGRWDNSNSQYGLLGVWSGAEAGIEVPGDYWAAVHKHWLGHQGSDGTWGYTGSGVGGTVSMNAAGTASLFVTEDYLYSDRFGIRVGREPFSPALKRALNWWEQKAEFGSPTTSWWGYTLYGIERVGLASGFKYFGKHDWYRELAREVVARQQPDGTWGDIVDTAYALLFLARGRHPILMNKLRFDHGGERGEIEGYWANRPRDAANLARYAGRQLERPLNWQVVALDREWHDWLDSPILSIASHRQPFFTDAEVAKLRQYVEAGGMLFMQADGDAKEFDDFLRGFAKRLLPQYPLADVPPGHVLYNALYKVDPPPPLKMVSNGSRVLLLYSPKDMARHWQLREEKVRENVFRLGVNLFVYAAGKRELRNRLSSSYVSPLEGAAPLGKVTVARLKYDGPWDPEPGAWRRFANWFPRQTGTAVAVQAVPVEALAPGAAAVAHLTGTADAELSPDAIKAIRAYVDGGGVLLVDAAGGSTRFAESMKSALAAAFPESALKSLPRNHPLLNEGPPGMEDLSKPKLRPYVIERTAASGTLQHLRSGQGAVIFSEMDVTSGLLGTETWGVFGYDPAYAQALVKNLIFWAMDGAPTG